MIQNLTIIRHLTAWDNYDLTYVEKKLQNSGHFRCYNFFSDIFHLMFFVWVWFSLLEQLIWTSVQEQ